MLLPQLEDLVLFLGRPLVAAYIRVDHIDPALTALARLAVATGTHSLVELFGDARPLLRLPDWIASLHALRCDIVRNLPQNLRFTSCPGRLLPLNVLNEEPSLLALA